MDGYQVVGVALLVGIAGSGWLLGKWLGRRLWNDQLIGWILALMVPLVWLIGVLIFPLTGLLWYALSAAASAVAYWRESRRMARQAA